MKKSFSMWRAGLAVACAMMVLAATAGADPFVVGWGMNANDQAKPVPVNALSGATNIAAGYHHSLAVVDSCVYAWGLNNSNQCTVPSAGRTNVVAVAAGGEFSAAIRKDGTLVIWGRTDVDSNLSGNDTNDVAQIAAGEGHLLLLKKDGRVLATGINSYAPECMVPEEARSGVVQIAAGAHYSLARKADGTIVSWGDDKDQQDGGTLAVPDSLQGHAVKIAAGHYHALAITDSGDIVQWGSIVDHVIPDGARTGATDIAGGYDFSIARTSDGKVYVWGDDTEGQQSDMPASVRGTASSQIAAGYGHCLVLGAGLAPCWIGDSVPDEAYVARAYSGYVSATGMPAVTYHQAGNWPTWLQLDPDTGVLSGKPAKTAARSSFSIIASNIYGTVTNRFEVRVADTPVELPVFITTTVDPGEVGVPYPPFQFKASNSPVFYPSQTNNFPLPAGLTLAENGILSGIPTEEYNSLFYVTASNEAGTVEQSFIMTIVPASAAPVFETTSPLVHATVGEDYSVTLETDRVAAFRIAKGTLPDGLGLEPATGVIYGTPTTAGACTFTVEAANSVGSTTSNLVLDVWAAPVITTDALPGGSIGETYARTISATGWPAPTFAVASGTIPAGLELDPSGAFSGKLKTAGTYVFTVKASNGAGEDTHTYTVVVDSVARPQFTAMSFSTNKVTLTWANGATNTYLEWSTNAAAASPDDWKSLGKRTSPWTGNQTNGPVIFYRLRNH